MMITAYIQDENNTIVGLYPLDDDPIMITIALAIPLLRDLQNHENLTEDEFNCTVDELFPYTEKIGNWVISELNDFGFWLSEFDEVTLSNPDSDDLDVIVS